VYFSICWVGVGRVCREAVRHSHPTPFRGIETGRLMRVKSPIGIMQTPPDSGLGHEAKLAYLKRLLLSDEQTRFRDRRVRVLQPNPYHSGESDQDRQGWRLGVDDIDDHLPCRGLNVAGVHELRGASYEDTFALSGYALALLGRRFAACGANPHARILWCQTSYARQEFGALHSAGLQAFGLNPNQFLMVKAARRHDLLWAMEEGARSSDLLAVVGEVGSVSLTQSRRLSLAAAAGDTTVLLLGPHNANAANAAETSWRIGVSPGAPDPLVTSAPGNQRWRVRLTRCRGGRTGSWVVEWCHETHRFSLAEELSSRSPEEAGIAIKGGRRSFLRNTVTSVAG
jgi:protein ImuA